MRDCIPRPCAQGHELESSSGFCGSNWRNINYLLFALAEPHDVLHVHFGNKWGLQVFDFFDQGQGAGVRSAHLSAGNAAVLKRFGEASQGMELADGVGLAGGLADTRGTLETDDLHFGHRDNLLCWA